MSKKVSVIVPAYNMSAYLQQTLESVCASDYDNYEVIVMDDGSKDNTLQTAQAFAATHKQVRVFTQPNGGVCKARNNAIRHSEGEYILPLDADDLITPDFIRLAAEVLDSDMNIKGVGCEAEFFGDRSGHWHLPKFSPGLLARKSIINASAMYRRADFDKTSGYNETFTAREDWDFWLQMFANGGEFIRLKQTCLYYRIRKGSKRVQDSKRKHELIKHINARHHDFLYRYLLGPLHYHRTWSRLINFFRSEKGNGKEWQLTENRFLNADTTIHESRNTIKQTDNNTVIKSFAKPCMIKSLLYGFLLKSKSHRSYEYAKKLNQLIKNATPQPVSYMEVRYCGFLSESYYECKKSECRHTFNELIGNKDFPNRETILKAIGRFTALLHENGIWHQDYSGGNILFNSDGSLIQLIDLNRIKFVNHIDEKMGCRGFERLNIDRQALTTMAHSYAKKMGYDPDLCAKEIITMRWKKHVKQGITNL